MNTPTTRGLGRNASGGTRRPLDSRRRYSCLRHSKPGQPQSEFHPWQSRLHLSHMKLHLWQRGRHLPHMKPHLWQSELHLPYMKPHLWQRGLHLSHMKRHLRQSRLHLSHMKPHLWHIKRAKSYDTREEHRPNPMLIKEIGRIGLFKVRWNQSDRGASHPSRGTRGTYWMRTLRLAARLPSGASTPGTQKVL